MATGGETRQKIDLDKIIEKALVELAAIEAMEVSQSEKTKRFTRLARSINTEIFTDKRRNKRSRIAITTYKRYLSRVRNAIKDAGHTHHSLRSERATADTLARVQRDYPAYAELLEPLRTADARTIGAVKNDILERVRSDKSNPARGEAYTAIKSIKTDHEVLRHLGIDDVTRADLKEQAAESLAKKKTSRVKVYYSDVTQIINDNLNSEHYSAAAFALALATGRRAIEVLSCGSFEATGANTVRFTGQAKKQAGIDSVPYEIYTLIDAQALVQAFERFRTLEPVKALATDFEGLTEDEKNRQINGRTAKTLNGAAKRLLDDQRRAFKDSRSIYTRVCLDKFHAESELADADEDVFAKALLGHGAISTAGTSSADKYGSDYTAALSYRQFNVVYGEKPEQEQEPVEAPTVEQEQEPVAATQEQIDAMQSELAPLEAAIDAGVSAGTVGAGIARYHQKVVVWRANNPDKAITVTALAKKDKGGIGGNRATVKQYVELYKAIM